MAVYLVQHGLAFAKEDDPGRGLTPEGIDKVRLIAEVAAHYNVRVARIEHSGKKRAEQTAQLIATALEPEGSIAVRGGIGPKDAVEPVAAALEPKANVMLVGHLPFMERLVSQLTTGCTTFAPLKFQNGGIVCLDRDEGAALWHIKWVLMPKIS